MGVTKVEIVLIGCIAVLLSFHFYTEWKQNSDWHAIQQTAIRFACDLKNAQFYARKQSCSVAVSMENEPGGTYCLLTGDGGAVKRHKESEVVSAAGFVQFDARGIPVRPGKFLFRKGSRSLRVDVAKNGDIVFPKTM